MKTKDAIKYFGSAARLAEALGISRPAVSQWGAVVPLGSAALIEKLTAGDVSIDPACYRRTLTFGPAPDAPDQRAA